MASIVALVMVIVILSTPVGDVFFDIYKHPFYSQFPESARFEVQRSVTIESSSGSFLVDLPKAPVISLEGGGAAQDILSASTNPTAGEKRQYNDWTWLTWAVSVTSSWTMSVDYTVETRTLKWEVQPSDSGSVDQIPADLKQKYLGREWKGENGRYKIDPQNLVLKGLAEEAAGDATTVYENLENIYFFLQRSYRYSQGNTGEEPKDALTTYQTKSGDCDEVSFLLISLLRSIGIPAWAEFGMLYDDIQGVWVGHAWVQMYIPLTNGGGYKVNLDPVNYQFLFRSANRLTEWVEDGNGAHLEDFYNYVTYSGASSPRITSRIVPISYESEGSVFMKDTTREINYVDSSGAVELMVAVSGAVAAFTLLLRVRRGRIR